jgi:putative ABC transport system substrate-binding protein
MNKRRELLVALGAGAISAPLTTFAQQQPGRFFRIGFLGQVSPAVLATSRVDPLRRGLRELGYVEGKNVAIEVRGPENYERLPDLAAELIGLKVDVLVTQGTPATLAAKQATTTIPIVAPAVGDPVATGLVASLARPGSNITGFTYFPEELGAKRLEFLKDALPRIRRVAVLLNPDNPGSRSVAQAMGVAAKSLKLTLQQFGVARLDDFETAFLAMAGKQIDAVVAVDDAVLNANVKRIADLAAEWRLPSAGIIELAEAGGLIAYGMNISEMYRRAASLVDKILKGAKPGDIPIERPRDFQLIINRKTAKALGLVIPQSLLLHADKVIE